jgi:hypothetical protein
MMIPIQRITRYNLLLEKILGYVDTSTQMAEIAEMVLKNRLTLFVPYLIF